MAAAQDRFRAAADREQGSVERAQRIGAYSVDQLLEQSYWLGEDLRGSAQVAYEIAAGLVARFIEAKRGEMVAQRATIQVYEQLAGLHEQFGHADRAAEALADAQRARDLHRATAAELAEYLTRIKAVEDKRARGTDRTGRAAG